MRSPWIITVTNQSAFPVRINADSRQLSFLVRSNQSKAYVECALPAAMRPHDSSRSLVLAAGEHYEEKVDPKLFCFGSTLDQLGPDTSITAFLGWKPDPKRLKAGKAQLSPFVLEPTGQVDFQAIKQISSQTVWLLGSGPATSQADPKANSASSVSSKISVHANRFTDASALRDAAVTATLRNDGDKTVHIHMRTDNLSFSVRRPDGQVTKCGGSHIRAVGRDFFQSLAPKASDSVTVLLGEVCPREFFTAVGVYEITSIVDATEDGSSFGLDAITGQFVATTPTLLRLQFARSHYYSTPPEGKP
jgi:hypothetical protein